MESESEEVMKIQFENKKRIEGIACGKSHSIAWNKQEIFGWG